MFFQQTQLNHIVKEVAYRQDANGSIIKESVEHFSIGNPNVSRKMKLINQINEIKSDEDISVSVNDIKFNDNGTVTVHFNHYTALIENPVQTFKISNLEKIVPTLIIKDTLFYDIEELLQMMGIQFNNLKVIKVENMVKISLQLDDGHYFQTSINQDEDVLQIISDKMDYFMAIMYGKLNGNGAF